MHKTREAIDEQQKALHIGSVVKRATGYYMVKIKDSKKLGHEPNSYQPKPHEFAPMYWNGLGFINYDEVVWHEDQLEFKGHVL